ncbi:MAG: hypothetical protein IJS93_01075 [Clostridia bacterium]|nr:hypothetical protein [Clostridia bacterium]
MIDAKDAKKISKENSDHSIIPKWLENDIKEAAEKGQRKYVYSERFYNPGWYWFDPAQIKSWNEHMKYPKECARWLRKHGYKVRLITNYLKFEYTIKIYW